MGVAWWGRMPMSDWTEREKLERKKGRQELLEADKKPQDSDELLGTPI